MATLAMLTALMLAQATPTIVAEARQSNANDVGFRALAAGRPADAIEVILANPRLADDPAALINLGTAHARLGQTRLAGRYYNAAIVSSDRYELELADGTWMDSRRAARLALARLGTTTLVAVR